VQSDVFNLSGLYHKMTLSSNYLYTQSSVRMTELPQLDRLNDDTTDQALRDIRVRQMFINPNNAAFLTSSNLFDPQFYALRRLIDSRVDTLDQMNILQLNLNQRLQTRRGIAASEHVVDWMTLDLGGSFFPQPSRDNFGESWGILEYDWVWNIGDRTALTSSGWFEPIVGGPRVYNFGGTINRPDGTNFYLGYRQIDPLESRSIVASVAYAFSAKYAIAASTNWDFGVNQNSYTLAITRIGTDLQFSLGVNYNSTLNSFGVQFEVLPNIVRSLGSSFRPMGFAPTARR